VRARGQDRISNGLDFIALAREEAPPRKVIHRVAQPERANTFLAGGKYSSTHIPDHSAKGTSSAIVPKEKTEKVRCQYFS